MKIGSFTATADGFAGTLSTLILSCTLTLVPADASQSEHAPDYRVVVASRDEVREIGAGWKRTGDKAGAYVALQIDDPAFIRPLRANLFHDEGDTHVLMWNRPMRRDQSA